MQGGHPIAFLSKALGLKNQGLSTYEKECLAILLVVDRWRPYLQHRQFIIQTDHKSLARLHEQRLTTSIQHRAFVKLMGLQYKIQYKKGTLNQAADALSRVHEDEELQALSYCIPKWTESLMDGYKDDPLATKMLTELAVQPIPGGKFTLQDGLLRYKGRVYVGTNTIAQNHILQALHSSGVGGHSGITATYHKVPICMARSENKCGRVCQKVYNLPASQG